MNRTFLFCAVVLVLVFLNWGFSLRVKTLAMLEQKRAVLEETALLQAELSEKQRMKRRKPVIMGEAFAKVVNEMNAMSTYSGLNMSFISPPANGKNNIESLCQRTTFRGVKGLALDIKVLKVGAMADVGSAMDSVYFLEHQTDFKINEVLQDSQEIRVKGMLYGI